MNKNSKELRGFMDFIFSKRNRKYVILVIVIAVGVAVTDIYRRSAGGDKYIVSEDGTLEGVYRSDPDSYSEFPLKVTIKRDGASLEKDVTLTLEGKKEEKKTGKKKKKKPRSETDIELESGISSVMSELSGKKGKTITLPKTLEDGSTLIWEEREKAFDPLMLLLAPVLIWIMYLGDRKKKQDEEKERISGTISALPSFSDHLVLMVDSGLTFHDAFFRITSGYVKHLEKSYFEKEMISVTEETRSGTSDLVTVLTRKAEEIGVRDLSRITEIIRDSQIRGSELSGRLRTESRVLWEIRKKDAEERGRMAETKLSIPLAILLAVLILITGAPAILQVKGG